MELRQKGNKNNTKIFNIHSPIVAFSIVACPTPVRQSFPQLIPSSFAPPSKDLVSYITLGIKIIFFFFPGMLYETAGSWRRYINHSCFLFLIACWMESFYLFFFSETKPFTSEKNLKYLEDHVQQRHYFIT